MFKIILKKRNHIPYSSPQNMHEVQRLKLAAEENLGQPPSLVRWHKLSPAVGLSLRLGAVTGRGEALRPHHWASPCHRIGPESPQCPRLGPHKGQSSDTLQVLPKPSAVQLPLRFHLQVEVCYVFLRQPNLYPVRLTKSGWGGLLPLHLVQKSRNKTLLQNFSCQLIAVLDHERLTRI